MQRGAQFAATACSFAGFDGFSQIGRYVMKSKKHLENYELEGWKLIREGRFLHQLSRKISALGVIGEVRNALTLLLACITRSLDDPVSCLLKGQSAVGKSFLAKTVISLFPPEVVRIRA